jgi:hypothetical protein
MIFTRREIAALAKAEGSWGFSYGSPLQPNLPQWEPSLLVIFCHIARR